MLFGTLVGFSNVKGKEYDMNLIASFNSYSSVHLTWNKIEEADGYQLCYRSYCGKSREICNYNGSVAFYNYRFNIPFVKGTLKQDVQANMTNQGYNCQ